MKKVRLSVEEKILRKFTTRAGKFKRVEKRIDKEIDPYVLYTIIGSLIELVLGTLLIILWTSGCCCFRRCTCHMKPIDDVEWITFDEYEKAAA